MGFTASKRKRYSMTLEEYMERENLTDEAMAKKIGVTRSAVSYYRSGKRMPSVLTMHQIEEATKREVTWDCMSKRWMRERKNLSV